MMKPKMMKPKMTNGRFTNSVLHYGLLALIAGSAIFTMVVEAFHLGHH